jgi:hypothetical protein
MSRTPKAIDLSTFKILLKYAQQQHYSKKEPIPELSHDTGKLESSLSAPFHTFDGKFLYKGVLLKAAMQDEMVEEILTLIKAGLQSKK